MGGKKRKTVLGIAIGLVLSALCVEIVLRAFVSPRFYSDRSASDFSAETLMWSPVPFRVDEHDAVSYVPDETVRLVNAREDLIEYDVSFHTNNLGLVDHVDYLPPGGSVSSARRIAIAGDSFVAGMHGGRPWIPWLRDRAQENGIDIELFNLGLSGASLRHAEKLLKSVDASVGFTEIVIIAHSDDFARGYWTPHVEGERVWFVREGETPEGVVEERPVGRILEGNPTTEELKEQIWTWLEEDWLAHQDRSLVEGSALAQLTYKVLRRVTGARKTKEYYFRANLDALTRIRDTYSDRPITFLHLPNRREIARGGYEFELQEPVTALGLEYHDALEETDWSIDMFHRYDAHPNATGYAHIASYVAERLGLELPATDG